MALAVNVIGLDSMRILQVCPDSYVEVGGISVHVRNVSDRLARKHDVTVIATNDKEQLPWFEVKNSVKVERFRFYASSNAYFFTVDMPLSAREESFKDWIGVENGVKVELHCSISWFGLNVLDNNFVVADPRSIRLMGQAFQTIKEEAEFALDMAHWIFDIQPLAMDGFSSLVLDIERGIAWQGIFHQAERYRWVNQLEYHLLTLNKLFEYAYSSGLDIQLKPTNIRVNFGFPFWAPLLNRIPFLVSRIIYDNSGFTKRIKMLQLSLRHYAWNRIWSQCL